MLGEGVDGTVWNCSKKRGVSEDLDPIIDESVRGELERWYASEELVMGPNATVEPFGWCSVSSSDGTCASKLAIVEMWFDR